MDTAQEVKAEAKRKARELLPWYTKIFIRLDDMFCVSSPPLSGGYRWALATKTTTNVSTKSRIRGSSLSIRAENKSYLNVNNNRSSPLENSKDQLLVACIQAKSGINVSNEEKDSVEEVIQSVEQYQDKDANVEDLAMGYWRVIYSTAPPPSNGQVIGPIVGTAFQSINKDNATYENVLAVGNWLTLRLKATYEVLENNRWTVTFKSIQVELFEKKEPVFVKDFPEGTTREWLTTFQDEEWRIVRAGRTEKELMKNVFVMRREKPWWET